MSHTNDYRGSYTAVFQQLMGLVLNPQQAQTVRLHITSPFYRLDDGPLIPNDPDGRRRWYRGDIHSGVDFNFESGTSQPLNQIGVSPVYAPITGTLAGRSPFNSDGSTQGDGAIFIQTADGFVHSLVHLDSFSAELRALVVGSGTVTLNMELGRMGGREGGNPTGVLPHVHYSVFAPGFVAGDSSTWNRLDPLVYWTPGVNPNATAGADGQPTGTGLHVFATPVTDWNDNGVIDTQGALSESAAFVREGQSSILKVGVNTPHTRPIELRIEFTNAPAGFRVADRSGDFAVQWNDAEKAAYITLPPTLDQTNPRISTFIELLMPEEDNDHKNEFLTYTVKAGYLDANNRWSDYNQTATIFTPAAGNLTVLDNDTPQAPGDILDPPPYNPDTQWLTNGTDQNNNASIAGVGPGHPDFIDFDGDGTNDNRAIQGTANADRIHGQGGDDDIYGNDGGDFLYGEKGDDVGQLLPLAA